MQISVMHICTGKHYTIFQYFTQAFTKNEFWINAHVDLFSSSKVKRVNFHQIPKQIDTLKSQNEYKLVYNSSDHKCI